MLKNKRFPCFLPNPGRLRELLIPGTETFIREMEKRNRKTVYDLIGVFHEGQIVSVDSRLPNKLVLEALRNRDIKELSEYPEIRPEYGYGHSRFDFFLANQYERCLLEVKSCTLLKDGVALFPDAITRRGKRHLEDLVKAKTEGYRACALFVIQRTGATRFSPNDKADPEFGKGLRNAALNGVEIFAYNSELIGNRVILRSEVDVELRRYLNS